MATLTLLVNGHHTNVDKLRSGSSRGRLESSVPVQIAFPCPIRWRRCALEQGALCLACVATYFQKTVTPEDQTPNFQCIFCAHHLARERQSQSCRLNFFGAPCAHTICCGGARVYCFVLFSLVRGGVGEGASSRRQAVVAAVLQQPKHLACTGFRRVEGSSGVCLPS